MEESCKESKPKALSGNSILASDDAEMVKMEVKEWGGCIYIGTMTVSERLAFDEKHCGTDGTFKNLKDPDLIYDMLEYCLKDELGRKLFDRNTVKALKSKNAKVIHKIFYKALSANYVTAEAAKVVKKK